MTEEIERGVLYVHYFEGKFVFLFYSIRNRQAGWGEFLAVSVAKGTGDAAIPLFADYLETAMEGGQTDPNVMAEFRKATDADLIWIVQNWESRFTISEWVDEMKRSHSILKAEELDRILNIAKEHNLKAL